MLTIKDPSKVVWADLPLEQLARGNCLDSDFTLRVYKKLKEQITPMSESYYYDNLIKKLLPYFANIEFNGLDVDLNKVNELDEVLVRKLKDLYNELLAFHFNKDANMSSADDVGDLLFLDDRGFMLYPPKTTPKNKPSTDKFSLTTILTFIDEYTKSK